MLALAIGLLSLRVRAIFFSMITLAVASAAAVLASQLSDITGGEDGLSFQLPPAAAPGFRLLARAASSASSINGRLARLLPRLLRLRCALFLVLLRIVNSPFGRVLQAIRENEFRAEALGYRVVAYRTAASVHLGAGRDARRRPAGAVAALQRARHHPVASTIMIDILLMVVIGGMGTMYGAVIGATLFVLAQSYLQVLMGARRARPWPAVPLLPNLAAPRPLASVARHPVHRQRLRLPGRHRRTPRNLTVAKSGEAGPPPSS